MGSVFGLLVLFALVMLGAFMLSGYVRQSAGCTEEAMQCPDGSYVGRVPPDCDFAPCPATTTITTTTTTTQPVAGAVWLDLYPQEVEIAAGSTGSVELVTRNDGESSDSYSFSIWPPKFVNPSVTPAFEHDGVTDLEGGGSEATTLSFAVGAGAPEVTVTFMVTAESAADPAVNDTKPVNVRITAA